MKACEQSIPPGGWHFFQPHPSGITIKLPERPSPLTKKELIELMTRYRVQNGIPVGDPEGDVDQYVCSKWPHYCTEGKNPGIGMPAGREVAKRPRLLDRVAQWAVSRWNSGRVEHQNMEFARRRAAVCVTCPRNRTWKNCGSCKDLIEITMHNLARLAQAKGGGPDGLKGCDVYGHDNWTACLLKDLPDASEARIDPPPFCWVRTER